MRRCCMHACAHAHSLVGPVRCATGHAAVLGATHCLLPCHNAPCRGWRNEQAAGAQLRVMRGLAAHALHPWPYACRARCVCAAPGHLARTSTSWGYQQRRTATFSLQHHVPTPQPAFGFGSHVVLVCDCDRCAHTNISINSIIICCERRGLRSVEGVPTSTQPAYIHAVRPLLRPCFAASSKVAPSGPLRQGYDVWASLRGRNAARTANATCDSW